MDVTAYPLKCILLVFGFSFTVVLCTGRQSMVGNRFELHKMVGISFIHSGMFLKGDGQHVLVLGTSPLCYIVTFVSNLVEW